MHRGSSGSSPNSTKLQFRDHEVQLVLTCGSSFVPIAAVDITAVTKDALPPLRKTASGVLPLVVHLGCGYITSPGEYSYLVVV